jgi:hypothetical protein
MRIEPEIAGRFCVALLLLPAFGGGAMPAAAEMRTRYLPDTQVLKIKWTGKIKQPMAAELEDVIAKWHGRATGGFELILDSGGGKMREGRKVIALLQKLKQTRRLATTIFAGRKCGSSCVPIFLQGQTRAAAAATLWLFHEVGKTDPKSKKLIGLRPERTQHYFQAYFVPAGVPRIWLDRLSKRIRGRDLWMTGREVFETGSNIINRKIGSSRPRKLHPLSR